MVGRGGAGVRVSVGQRGKVGQQLAVQVFGVVQISKLTSLAGFRAQQIQPQFDPAGGFGFGSPAISRRDAFQQLAPQPPQLGMALLHPVHLSQRLHQQLGAVPLFGFQRQPQRLSQVAFLGQDRGSP